MSEMVICRGCKKQLHRTARVCPDCGAPQPGARRGKSRIGAALLAFFFGGLGIHRFYLGQWWGIFYLLFFWTFIPAIIAFVEFIVFLCTSDEKWDDRYNDGVHPEGGTGIIVVAVVAGFFIITFMIGILAAIALPAYQDYTMRVKTAEAMVVAKLAGKAVADYYEKTQTLPQSLQDAGYVATLPPSVRGIAVNGETGVLTVTMKWNQMDGQSFMFVPALDQNKRVVWQCVPGEINPRFLPRECRPGTAAAQ